MLEVFISLRTHYRYSTIFQNKLYYFGHPNILTYVDGVKPHVRSKYIQLYSKDTYKLNQIVKLIPSTNMFEYYILWGHSQNIDTNINHLNALLCKKYKGIDYYY